MGSTGSSQKIQIDNYSSIKPAFFTIKKTNYFMRQNDEILGMYSQYRQQTKVHELSGTLMKKKMTIFLTGTIGLYGMFKPADKEFSATPMKQVPNLLINTNKTVEIEILYQNIGVLYIFTENHIALVIMHDKNKLREYILPRKLLEPFNPFYVNCPSENLVIDFLQGHCSFDEMKDFKCIKTIDTVHLTPSECSRFVRKIIPSKDYNIKFVVPIIKILGHLFPPDIKFSNTSTTGDIMNFKTNRNFNVSVQMYEYLATNSYLLRITVNLGDLLGKKIIVDIKINDLIKTHVVMYNSSTRSVSHNTDTDFEYTLDWIAKHCTTYGTIVTIWFDKSNINVNYNLISGIKLFVKTDIMLKNQSFVKTKKKIYDLFYSKV